MNTKENMAIAESSHIFNPSTSESFLVNPIEIYSMLKDDKPIGKLVNPSWQNNNTDEETLEKNGNIYFGLFKQHLSATYLNK